MKRNTDKKTKKTSKNTNKEVVKQNEQKRFTDETFRYTNVHYKKQKTKI